MAAASSSIIRWQGPPPAVHQAAALAAVDDYRGALDLMTPQRLAALAPDHPDTLTTRHNIAHLRGERGSAM